ncbi:MAG: ABC transporter permease [Bacillota bacterium]
MTTEVKNKLSVVKKHIYIIKSMVVKNVKNQYRRSVLGIVWTVLNPLLNMIVLALVFTNIFGRDMQAGMDFAVYVLTGNIVMGIFRGSTSAALPSMVSNYDLMTKTKVPYYIFPVANVFSAVVNFGFSLIALFAVMAYKMSAGVEFHWTILLMPVTFLPAIMLFSIGVSFILCTMYVYFRDIKHIYGVFLTLLTYCTPLFYDISIMSESMQEVIKFNPMYHFVTYFRDIMVLGVIPSARDTITIFGLGVVFMILGVIIFRWKRKKFVFNI